MENEKKQNEKEIEKKELVCANPTGVSYDANGVKVSLDAKTVRNYLVHGNSNYVTDGEIALFMNTCMVQGVNPWVSGEVYLIKYSKEQPAQMVVGKEFYIKRAYENPAFRAMKSGIIVLRGGEVKCQEGTCPWPSDKLIGGWCRIIYERGGKEYDCYKEVSLQEYSSGKSSWTSKPATMIAKVAISQCARDAFPSDFEGLYTIDEMTASGAIDAKFVTEELSESGEEFVAVNVEPAEEPVEEVAAEVVDERKVTKEERQAMFAAVQNVYGREDGNNLLKAELESIGVERSADLTFSQYENIMSRIDCLGA